MLQLTDPFVIQANNNTQSWINDFVLFDRDANGNAILPVDTNISLNGPLKSRYDNYSYEQLMLYIQDMPVRVNQIKLHVTTGVKVITAYMPLEFREFYKVGKDKPLEDFTTKFLQPGPPQHDACTTFFLNRELSLYSRLIFNLPPYTHLIFYFFIQPCN
jgi:hypothetical protein